MGVVREAPVNTPRFEWATIASERRPVMRLEAARTNEFSHSDAFNDASWTKSETTVAFDSEVATDGVSVTFDRIFETVTNANHYVLRATPTFTAGANQSVTVDVKTKGRTKGRLYLLNGSDLVGVAFDLVAKTVTDISSGGGVLAASAIEESKATGYSRICFTGKVNNTSTSANAILLIRNDAGDTSYAGDVNKGLIAGNFQFEKDSSSWSSRIRTTTGALSRAADQFYWDYVAAPQAKIIYSRHVERGTAFIASARLWQIGRADNTAPKLTVYRENSDGRYAIHHNNTVSNVEKFVASTPARGDTHEVVAILFADGSVKLIVSINGGAVAGSTASGALALATSWSDTRLWLNSSGTGDVGLNDFADLKLVKYADVVASTDQGIMDELRAFELSPAGEVL